MFATIFLNASIIIRGNDLTRALNYANYSKQLIDNTAAIHRRVIYQSERAGGHRTVSLLVATQAGSCGSSEICFAVTVNFR